MSSIPNQIVENAISLVNAPAPPSGVPRAKRCFTYAIDPAALPDLVFYLVADDNLKKELKPEVLTQLAVHFAAEVRVVGDSSTPPDLAADPILVHVYGRLVGQEKGVTAGSLYWGIYFDGIDYKYSQADRAYCMAVMKLVARTQVKSGNLEAWA